MKGMKIMKKFNMIDENFICENCGKKVLKLIINSILGAILIYIINLIGSTWGFYIGINILTSIH